VDTHAREVYLKDYRDVQESINGLGGYVEFYNHERLHQPLDYRKPAVVYRHGKPWPWRPPSIDRRVVLTMELFSRYPLTDYLSCRSCKGLSIRPLKKDGQHK
jgi:hypothetical protein